MLTRVRGASVVLASLAAAAMIAGPIAAAQASDASIVSAIRAATPKIQRSQAKVLDGLAAYENTHSATRLVRATAAQDALLRSLRTTLSHRSASSADGRRGRTDVVTGLTLIIDSNGTLARELRRASAGHPLSRSRLSAAIAADRRGNADLRAGIRSLQRT